MHLKVNAKKKRGSGWLEYLSTSKKLKNENDSNDELSDESDDNV